MPRLEDLNTIWTKYKPENLSDAEVIAWAITELAVALKEHTAAVKQIDVYRE